MNCIAKSKASKWVETWCRNGVEELHATALCNANIFLRSGHACTVKPGVATEFRHEKWQMSPNQMPPCIPCITYMHSTVFLRSGQACTLPPGVARESRNDQCQMSPNQMLPVQNATSPDVTLNRCNSQEHAVWRHWGTFYFQSIVSTDFDDSNEIK